MSVWRRGAAVGALVVAAGMFTGVATGDPLPSASPSEVVPTPTPAVTPEAPSPTPAPETPAPTPTASPMPSVGSSATPGPSTTPDPTSAPPAPSGPLAPRVYSGARNAPVIALTIDDCFNDAVVLQILGILQEQQVNATFFPIGRTVADSAGVWRQVSAAGFPVANHTWSHANLTTLTYDQVVADLRRFNSQVAGIIGRPVVPVMRPNAGVWNDTVLRAAAAAGERAVVMWDTVFGDTGGGTVDDLVRNATRGRWGSILLMHANQERSALALPAVIAYYRSQGYQFVTVGQLLGVGGPVPYGPYVSPPTPTASPSPTATPSPSPSATPSPSVTTTPADRPTEPTPEPSASPGSPSWFDEYGAVVVVALAAVGVMAGGGAAWYARHH